MAYIGKSPDSLVTGQSTSEDIFPATVNQDDSFGTVYILDADITTKTDIIVTINGVLQSGSAYSMGGTGNRTLTFTAPLTVGDELRVLHIGFKPTTTIFADNTVTNAKMADNAINSAEIADDAITTDHLLNDAVTAEKIHDDVELGGPSKGASSVIRTNANIISENITLDANTNGMSAGPISVASGYTITVPNGTAWSII